MKESPITLVSRVSDFARIISSAQCTTASGNTLQLEAAMQSTMCWLRDVLVKKSMLYIIGNGGSAAVASHAQIDFINVAKLRTQVLHEPSVMTCMANDYQYENVFANLLKILLNPSDMLIAISSSGRSQNIRNAVSVAKEIGARVISLTGFKADNPLRKVGDINFWLDSTDYGFVEVGHQFILHNLSDRFGVLSQHVVMETAISG